CSAAICITSRYAITSLISRPVFSASSWYCASSSSVTWKATRTTTSPTTSKSQLYWSSRDSSSGRSRTIRKTVISANSASAASSASRTKINKGDNASNIINSLFLPQYLVYHRLSDCQATTPIRL